MVVVGLFVAVGRDKSKRLDRLSPKEVMDLYEEARNDGDVELLQKIIYFPPGTSEAAKKSKAAPLVAGTSEKGVMGLARAKVKAEYEEILDEETAEVGVVLLGGIPGMRKRVPFQQVILRKDAGVWKRSHSKHELTEEQLVSRIRENPYDASAIYHLGGKYASENQARAIRYYRKYCELEPKGFWISKELKDLIESYENVEQREKELLDKLQYIPEQSSDRAGVYRALGQLFTEHGEYEKAGQYFVKAEEILKFETNPRSGYRDRFERAKRAFELEIKGESFDLLKELESEGVYQ